MKILVLAKRFYTSKDLVFDDFGRLFFFPDNWSKHADVQVVLLDYYNTNDQLDLNKSNFCLKSFGVSPKQIGLFSKLAKINRSVREFSPDLIFASGDLIVGSYAAYLSKKLRVSWFFDIYDDYRYFKLSRLTGLNVLMPLLCRKAKGVITVSECLKAICDRWSKSAFIARNGFDKQVFYKKNSVDALSNLSLSGDLVYVAYTGGIDSRFDETLVLRAFDLLFKKNKFLRFLHAGVNYGEEIHFREWYIGLGNLPQFLVNDVINASIACIAPYQETPLSKSCDPCKLSEYSACEVPVISASIEGLQDYEENGVNFYEFGNLEQFIELLEMAISNNLRNTSPVMALEWNTIANNALNYMMESEKNNPGSGRDE